MEFYEMMVDVVKWLGIGCKALLLFNLFMILVWVFWAILSGIMDYAKGKDTEEDEEE